jgi:hypothetical protein
MTVDVEEKRLNRQGAKVAKGARRERFWMLEIRKRRSAKHLADL